MGRIRSMTGYGKGEHNDGKKNIIAEIKTINNRYSDINIKAPKHLRPYEENIRKIIKNQVSRGRVDVFFNIEYIKESETVITADLNLAKQYKNAILAIKEELNLNDEPRLDTIIKFQDVLMAKDVSADEDELKKCVDCAVEMALNKLLLMRENEGKQLKDDILIGIDKMMVSVQEIKIFSSKLVYEYKERLEAKITELLGNKYELDENRLYNEIVFYSDKSDINEELIRLESHISQLKDTLFEGGAVGRKIDFIIQEANREINTIGSKIGNIEITKVVIEVKNILEKIREQVQNIE